MTFFFLYLSYFTQYNISRSIQVTADDIILFFFMGE